MRDGILEIEIVKYQENLSDGTSEFQSSKPGPSLKASVRVNFNLIDVTEFLSWNNV